VKWYFARCTEDSLPIPRFKKKKKKEKRKKKGSLSMEHKPHIAILPSPGMGHLIPLVELAKILALRHDYRLTCIIPTIGSPSKAMKGVLEALPTSIDHVFLPPVNLNDLPAGEQPGIQVFLTMTRSLPSIRDVLKSLVETSRLAAVILDHTATDPLGVAKELNLSPYIFFTSSALALSLLLHLPKLDETISCEYRDLPEPLRLPGCVPLDGGDLMDHVQDRKSELYRLSLLHTKRLRLAEGIMVNTFMDLQGRAIKALEEEGAGNPTIYPIGPIIQTASSTTQVGLSFYLYILQELCLIGIALMVRLNLQFKKCTI
jgi:hydroquinone glucosyltransferase